MTIISNDSHPAAPTYKGGLQRIADVVAALFACVAAFREAGKASEPGEYYQHHKTAQLESAHRDVNRMWRNQL